MVNLDFYAAFLIGLMGAGHCIGMCGGVAAAITIGMPENTKNSKRWIYLLNYNFGRLVAYTVAGAIIGAMLASIATINGSNSPLIFMRFLAAIMMIILALYIGQWWFGLNKIERVGQVVWRYISPLASSFLPLKSPIKALPFGFLWGWLPCGLVYSTLTWAAVSGSALNGAIVMLAFGLGTLPAMLAVGGFATQLKICLKNLYFRRVSALLLMVYGIQTGYIAIKQIL
ncbi:MULTISPECIES: sulfite exporter TauE/SafE family protein [unclassified Photobacterium]|uniref:sulfite exporter TauE/SafE family protein n=1 Tax=unclassified Photobacterium TaxID=2628852 RepID=UPI000D17CB55|nr:MULTISPECIES: sulfite exporter TauE/SafE family protein [unclassified Photobacterium]PSV27477.1 cytochrome biogenesis protein [Photobacterium sp. GB-56]PSV31256.1 cytochrome biogenesis protein [Photobacterium sp. GB-72]PSV34901.1 cytochrome biogenesis protein [Photobacterium sp. GB-210]PSV37150.1 cytochrome biogenesis protein [Photobacterium sp. GB-27]PSV44654.1 cytochrome biogenesis protein [Photobacterium sp. GB-36]